jgi:phosphohistidine phosphatase
MHLILVRHAKAFERDTAAWPDDTRRPLTAGGRDAFGRLAKRLGRSGPRPVRVWASPAVRAWQTAQILHERGGWPQPERTHSLGPDLPTGPQEWSRMLNEAVGADPEATVAWVGHEPMLGRCAGWLLCGETGGIAIAFKKGAAVGLDLSEGALAAPGGEATLAYLLTPRLAGAGKRHR